MQTRMNHGHDQSPSLLVPKDSSQDNAAEDLEARKTVAPSRSRSRETSGLHPKRPNSHEFGYKNPSRRWLKGRKKMEFNTDGGRLHALRKRPPPTRLPCR